MKDQWHKLENGLPLQIGEFFEVINSDEDSFVHLAGMLEFKITADGAEMVIDIGEDQGVSLTRFTHIRPWKPSPINSPLMDV
jgi:hypothetical protein